jgi:integrase/recombinase XerD
MPKEKNELTVYKPQSLKIQDTAWNALSENSKAAYKSDFDLFFKFINKKPNDITASDILAFIEHLKAEGYKNSSINRKIASLSKMFRVLKYAQEIKENPVDMLKEFKNINMKTSKEVRSTLTMQEVQKAVVITKNTTPTEKKLILIIRALAKTGLRISELLFIRNKDMTVHDSENMTIRIVGKGNKERFIFLDNKFIREIQKMFPETDKTDLLFYTNRFGLYDRREVWRSVRKFFQERIGKHVHPHMLRHLFITYKISIEKQDIKAVSRYCGHQDISTTLNMYVDTALDVKKSKIKI